MCFIYDGYNEFSNSRIVKAKKQHRCYECREPIVIGERYRYHVAKFEGDFSTTKTCRRCEYLRHEISKKEIELGCAYHESWAPYGEVVSSLKEYGLTLIGKDEVPVEFVDF